MEQNLHAWQVVSEAEGERLDIWLAHHLGSKSSRSEIQRWIREGWLLCDGAKVRPSHRLSGGEVLELTLQPVAPLEIVPQPIDFTVLYEDSELAVIIKPPGISVHPGPGQDPATVTLLSGLLHRWPELASGEFQNDGSEANESDEEEERDELSRLRPGIVHRLDKPTEGILLVARTSRAQRELSRAFMERRVEKEYVAWLTAAPNPPRGTIEAAIRRHPNDRLKMRLDPSGRSATTHYRTEEVVLSKRGRKYAYVTLNIPTGRTHQIRVHMASLGAPVVGDQQYSRHANRYSRFGLLLLARTIRFEHPSSRKAMEFTIDMPERFHDFARIAPQL